MKRIIVAAGAALLATACSGGPEEGDESADSEGTASGSGVSQGDVEAQMADVSITPGQWENTFEFVAIDFDETQVPEEARPFAEGMIEEMVGETRTTTDCITPEEASEPRGELFSGNDNASCQYDRFSLEGGQIDMAMSCDDPDAGGAQFTGTGSYTPDSYDMTMTVEMGASSMGAMTINARSTGQRVGECPAQ